MPWVRFTEDFDERITPRAILRRREGSERFVRRSVASDAIAAGKAVAITRPRALRSTYDGRVRKVSNGR